MKQDVNYVVHHQNVSEKINEDDISPIDISMYNALFLIWNGCGFDSELSINRNDLMRLSKIGNKNTYTRSLKKLHDKGYIIYKPSHNPLKGSKVTITRCDTSDGYSGGKSIGKGSGYSGGYSGGTLSKPLNYKTIKLLLLKAENLNNSQIEEVIEFIDEKYLKGSEDKLFHNLDRDTLYPVQKLAEVYLKSEKIIEALAKSSKKKPKEIIDSMDSFTERLISAGRVTEKPSDFASYFKNLHIGQFSITPKIPVNRNLSSPTNHIPM